MAAGREAEGRRRRPFARGRRVAAWALLLFVLLGPPVYLLRNVLLAPTVIRLAAWIAERELGGTLEIDSLAGSWWGDVTLSGVRFARKGDEGPLVRLAAEEVAASYSLVGLLRGEAGWLESVRLAAGELELDLAAAKTEAPGEAEPGALRRSLLFQPPALDLAVERLVVHAGGGREIAAAGLAVRTPPGGPPSRYAIAARTVAIAGEAPEVAPSPLAARVALAGGVLAVEELALGPAFAIRAGTVDLTALDAGRIAWRLPLAIGAGEGEVRGTLDPARIVAEAALQDVGLAGLAPFLPPAAEVPPAGVFTLAAQADLPRAAGAAMTVRLEGTGRDLVVAGRTIDRLLLRGAVADEILRVETLEARAGENEITGRDLVLPLDAGALGLLHRGTGRLEVRLRDMARLAGAPHRAELASTLPSHRVELAARLGDGAFALESGRILTAGGAFAVRRGRIALGADPDRLLADGTVEVNLDLDFADLGPLGALLGQEGWRGRLTGGLALRGPLLSPAGELVAAAQEVVVSGVAVDEAEATVHAAGGRVVAERLAARGAGWEATAEGTWDVPAAALAGVRAAAHVPDLASLTGGRVTGSATIALSAAGPLAAPHGAIELWAADVAAAGRHLGGLALSGAFTGPSLAVENLVLAGPEGRIHARGQVALHPETKEVEALVRELVAARGGATLALAGPAAVRVAAGEVHVAPFVLAGDLGRAAGSLERTPERTTAALALERFDAMPLLAPFLPAGARLSPLEGRLGVEIAGGGTRLLAELSVAEIVPAAGEPPWSLELSATLSGGLLAVTRFALHQPRIGSLRAVGDLPVDPFGAELLPAGELDLLVGAEVAALEALPERIRAPLARAAGRAAIYGRITGPWRAPRGWIEVRGEGIRLPGPAAAPAAIGPLAGDLVLRLDGGLCIEKGELRADGFGTAVVGGKVAASLDVPALLAAGLAPLRAAGLALTATVSVPDLAWTARYVPAVRRAGGRIEGTLQIGGSLGDPLLAADFSVAGGELRLENAFPALRSLSGRIHLAGSTLRVDRFTGEFGASPFTLAGTIERGAEGPELALDLAGTDLLLYRTRDTIVRADVRLGVRGALSALRVEGDVALTGGRFGRDVDLFSAVRGEAAPPAAQRGLDLGLATDPPLSQLTFDVAIRAAEPFALENNVIHGALRPDLHLGGTAEVPVLRGRVYLDETFVALPSGRLRVSSGLVAFGAANPFVPTLELIGTTRLKGYDIRVRVAGDYDDPEIELSSVPPLPSEDLAILFLTGQLPAGSAGERGVGAAQSVAVYVAQDIVKRWWSEGGFADEESILERLEIEIGADVTRSGAATARVVYLLTARSPDRRMARYLVGERDVYDFINFGYGWRFRFR
ncbi:MAG: translocation/assembly module TamB domain-containing protein [Planctomycetota bacterium]